ncbi:ImuA family protein [Tepidicaulis sp.]|uniref:ImuA family protein n=1 Tax=Tepidicaulis sp. TaxID=1920809 RepID=UPI003B5CF0AC
MSGETRGTSRSALMARLRQSIAEIEQSAPVLEEAPAARSREEGADPARLILRPGLHELTASYEDMSAARGFALAVLAARQRQRQRRGQAAFLWAMRLEDRREFGAPYGPGLLDARVSPERLLTLYARSSLDVLWALEEGLKAGALAGALGEAGDVGLTESRRLSLLAAEHRMPCWLIRPLERKEASAALTRLRIRPAPSGRQVHDLAAPGAARWQVELEKAKAGPMPFRVTMEWDHETHCFHMVAPLADRALPAAPKTQSPPAGEAAILPLARTG